MLMCTCLCAFTSACLYLPLHKFVSMDTPVSVSALPQSCTADCFNMDPNLLCADPQIKQLLAHTAYYLAVSASNTSTFLQFLRIKSQVQTSVVRDALVEWGKRDAAKPGEAAIFCSSLAHLKHVYGYLYENLPPKVSLRQVLVTDEGIMVVFFVRCICLLYTVLINEAVTRL